MSQIPESEEKQDEQQVPQQPPQREDHSRQAIKFITERLHTKFDEESARKLFGFYTIDGNDDRLEAPDVRKLLLDLLQASKHPLVVPDEALDAVLYDLCLSGKGAITWVEFKSFFAYLQEKPLLKLFQIITKLYSNEQLRFARLISVTSAASLNQNNNFNQNENENENQNENENENENESNNNNDGESNIINSNNNNNDNNDENKFQFDRQAWKQVIADMIPEAGPIFIYFLGGGSLLALVIGSFSSVLEGTQTAEIIMDGISYVAEMRAFDCENDIFPPIARAGGMKSKLARRIADTYLVTKSWDEDHLNIGKKVGTIAKKTEEKLKFIDERYKVKEKFNEATKSAVSTIKTIDEQHQISKRVSDTAKSFDEKWKITEKVSSTVASVQSNAIVQSISSKFSWFAKNAFQTVDDISKETKQLVSEKQTQNNDNGNDNQLKQESNQIENEYGSNNDNIANNANANANANESASFEQVYNQYNGNNNDSDSELQSESSKDAKKQTQVAI